MALFYGREYSFGSSPLGHFLSAGRMVSATSSAADGRGPRAKRYVDPAAVALRISPRAPGGLAFIHVLAALVARLRSFEISRAPVARNLDAGSAVRVGTGRYKLLRLGRAGTRGPRSVAATWTRAADVAAAGNWALSARRVHSDHAGAHDGAADGSCKGTRQFTACERHLQSLLPVCVRVGCGVDLGAGDCDSFGDCRRVTAGICLREAGSSAIVFVLRGTADGDDLPPDCSYAAHAADPPVADPTCRDNARNDDTALCATLARRLARFGGRDWLVGDFLAQTLRRAALARALGSSGATGRGSCQQ